jgi:MFS family permease
VTSSERKILWTTSLSHGLIHIYELAVPALLILIQADFAAGDFAMGRIVTLYGLLFGLGALPAGFLVDRLGSRRLLTVCLWGAAVCTAGMAISPSLVSLAACAACMGLCLSIYHPAGTALITHSLPVSGRIFATHGMLGNLGVAGASVIAGTLGALFGWRWALGLLSLLGVVLGFRVSALPTPTVTEVRRLAGRGRWPGYVVLLVAMAFMGMVYRGMTTFLPKLFATRYASEASTGTAVGGLLTTLALLVGLLGMYVAGRAIDRGVRPARVFLIGAVVQMPFLLAIARAGGSGLLPLMMAVAFFHFFTQPPGNYLVAGFVPPRLRGVGYGLYFFVAFGTGSFGAAFGGWVSERYGLAQAFSALAFLLIPAIGAALVLSFSRLGARPSEDPLRDDSSATTRGSDSPGTGPGRAD